MMKRIASIALGFFAVFLACTASGHAFTLLTEKEALVEVFGPDVKIIKQTVRLKGDTLDRIQKRLGGNLVYYQEGSESAVVTAKKRVTFYFAEKDGEKVGVAMIDVEPGKWGPVEFIVAMDLTGVVTGVRVMSYQEKRGRPIARRSYLDQYVGKSSKSMLQVGRDITGVSGATISSRSATFTVKKAIAIFEEVYLNR